MPIENDKVETGSAEDVFISIDIEADVATRPTAQNGLRRQMKDRHITMIGIGGVIGTGLFLGTANALRGGGPIGMLIAYIVMGSVCYTVMISLGEMIAFLPIPGGHLTLAERFVDPAWSFALGWLYWYNWTITLPTELSAASVVLSYWNKDVNSAAWISMCLAVVLIINVFGAGAYGEAEFVFASIKVITISGLIVLGIVLDLGGGPDHDRVGFRYWKNPGPFVQYDNIKGVKGRFLGWSAVMSQAAFAYVGTEIVAIAGAEVKNPRKNIPKAIKSVYIRLLLFYIGGVTIIGLLVPSNDERLDVTGGTAAASPFVIAIDRAGIKVLPSIINAAILSSAWSAANSDLYSSSRALYSLALNGNAPSVFLKVTRHGLPWVAVAVCALFSFLSFMATNSGSGKVFTWLSNMNAMAGLTSWFGITVTYIRFYRGLKAQNIDRTTLPYRSPLQPFAGWYATVGCLFVMLFSGWTVFLKDHWQADTFVTNYFPMMFSPVLYVGARLWKHASLVPYSEMDFKSGLEEVINASINDGSSESHSWAKRTRAWLTREHN